MQTSQYKQGVGGTDVTFQSVKLYVEGVQIPFISISITQGIGQLPSATVQVPPQSGLMDIARYYQPKVHVFFEDPVSGDDRVLFSGLISAVAYQKSAEGPGSIFIQFECKHRNSLLEGLTLDFSGMINNAQVGGNASTGAESVLQRNSFNSLSSIELAMKGMIDPDPAKEVNAANIKASNGDYTKVDPRVLPKDFEQYKERLRGFAGVIVNYWNQMKEEVYNNPDYFQSMKDMYIPLFEQGLRFIQRLSGHHVIESLLDQQKCPTCPDDSVKDAQPGDRLIPPAFMLNTKAAIQADLAIAVINHMGQFSGELTDLYKLLDNFFQSIDYQMITLSSPAMATLTPAKSAATPVAASNSDQSIGDKSGITQDANGIVSMDGIPFDKGVTLSEVKTASNIMNVVGDPMGALKSKALDMGSNAVKGVTGQFSNMLGSFGFGSSSKGSSAMPGYAAVDTIVKPELPFYFAPKCNVYMPNMFWSIMVQQDEVNIPSRITVTHNMVPGNNKIGTNYRAPASIREAVAAGNVKITNSAGSGDLLMTTAATAGNNNIGKYEQGRGIKHQRLIMPDWLAFLNQTSASSNPNDAEYTPEQKANVDLLQNAWNDRYGASKSKLNPWSNDSGIPAYQRILFAAADYKFTMEVVKAKAGTLVGIFNPYIVPGYPMEIIDRSPIQPSFHAYCTSVTHNISASSISTSVSFAAAITYDELSNYYLQYVHPWLQTTLKMVNKTSNGHYTSSILGNAEGLQIANQFYGEVLGVDAVSPDQLFDFASGTVQPLGNTSAESNFSWATGREANPNHTAIGTLSLVRREIEPRASVETDWGVKFIDMDPQYYNDQVISYTNPNLTSAQLLEPGASLFLDYPDINTLADATGQATGTVSMGGSSASKIIDGIAGKANLSSVSQSLNNIVNSNPFTASPFGSKSSGFSVSPIFGK